MTMTMPPPAYRMSQHALRQVDARGLSIQAVQSALFYGRTVWTRGARIFAAVAGIDDDAADGMRTGVH